MGYRIEQLDTKFRLKAANIPAALDAARLAMRKHLLPVKGATDTERLVDLVWQWHWELEVEPATGDIAGLQFHGEKLLDEQKLFAAIAPFVEAGSFICVVGQDHEAWRWYFDGGELVNQPGTTAYEFARVVVAVRGGKATVKECPPGMEVQIVDRGRRAIRRPASTHHRTPGRST